MSTPVEVERTHEDPTLKGTADTRTARMRRLEVTGDETTVSILERCGVQPGFRCLEVGGGAGSIARWLLSRVRPHGSVVVTDVWTDALSDLVGVDGVEVRRHDIAVDPLEPSAYDLVHARGVLEHIPSREDVVTNLVEATAPGGWIVIEDVYFTSETNRATARFLTSSLPEGLYERVLGALLALYEGQGADGGFGARLPGLLVAGNLHDVGAEIHGHLVRGSTPDRLSAALVTRGLLTADEASAARSVLCDPESRFLSLLMVSAWGRK